MADDKFSKNLLQYKEYSQLMEYASAQEKTILQISKKLQKAEEERDYYKKLSESSPGISNQPKELQKIDGNQTEDICHNEIYKLKEVSSMRELTYEETKKLEIYFKVLTQINHNTKPLDVPAKKMTDEQLLKLVEASDKK